MAWQLYVAEFPNGKKYFGITSDLARRKRQHRWDSLRGSPFRFHRALMKYGMSNVVFRTMVVGDRDYILDLEIRAIDAFKTRDHSFGYNISVGGDLTPMHGRKFSAEARAKMSAAKMGKKQPPEHTAKIAASNTGKKRSPESRAKTSSTMTGIKHSPDRHAKRVATFKRNRADAHKENGRIG